MSKGMAMTQTFYNKPTLGLPKAWERLEHRAMPGNVCLTLYNMTSLTAPNRLLKSVLFLALEIRRLTLRQIK